jgi:integrase
MKALSPDWALAKPLLTAWLGQLDKLTPPKPDTAALTTWGQFKSEYLRSTNMDVSLADKSKLYRAECCARIVKTWGKLFVENIEDRQIAAITRSECERWAHSITYFYTGTYNNTIATMKLIFADAIEAGRLIRNPAATLKRVAKIRNQLSVGLAVGEAGETLTPLEKADLAAKPNEQRWYPNPAEFAKIIARMRQGTSGPERKAADLAELLFQTSCRLIESQRLCWEDVDWQRNRLRIDGAKGRSEPRPRYLPLFSDLAELLRRLDAQPHGTDIAKAGECRGTMQRACVKLGYRKLDHHDCRHSFATRYVNAGVPVPVVSDWLGHLDGGTLLLKTYRRADDAESQRWAKLCGAAEPNKAAAPQEQPRHDGQLSVAYPAQLPSQQQEIAAHDKPPHRHPKRKHGRPPGAPVAHGKAGRKFHQQRPRRKP